jgi:thioredoxin 1
MKNYKPDMEKKFKDEQITVLLFVSSHCPYCHQARAILEDLSIDYPFKFILVPEGYDALARKYKVMSVPTIIILHYGKVVGDIVGLIPKFKLKEAFDKILEKSQKENE